MTTPKRICIIGGTGFVGRALVKTLLSEGHRVVLVSRHPERHRDLNVFPLLRMYKGDVHDRATLRKHFKGCDAVVNLVGILNERPRRGETFERVHHRLAGRIAECCVDSGVPRLLHMSALKVSEEGPSEYLKSKFAGELAVKQAAGDQLGVTVFRPSVIFGPRDGFTRLFVALLRQMPVLPLACPDAQFQPVYIDDVVHCFAASLDLDETIGEAYELAGPTTYSLEDLVRTLAKIAGTHHRIIRLNDTLSKLQAKVMQFAPGKPFTPDNYLSMQVASTSDEPFPDVFGIQPQHLEAVAPTWLVKHENRFDVFRRTAQR